MTTAQTMRAALEGALADDPDDLATHRAYADFLSEAVNEWRPRILEG